MTCCTILLVDETGQLLTTAVSPSYPTPPPPPPPGTKCGGQCEPFLMDDNYSLVVTTT